MLCWQCTNVFHTRKRNMCSCKSLQNIHFECHLSNCHLLFAYLLTEMTAQYQYEQIYWRKPTKRSLQRVFLPFTAQYYIQILRPIVPYWLILDVLKYVKCVWERQRDAGNCGWGECLIRFLRPSFLLTLKQLSVAALLALSLHLTLCLSPSDRLLKIAFHFPRVWV